jgi:uncharacterized RDD family membrane protein YckC
METLNNNQESKLSSTIKTVTPGIRIAYYFVDIIISLALFFAISLLLQLTPAMMFVVEIFDEPILISIYANGFNLFYYLLFESLFGATPAKLIFGYTVITSKATKPGFLRVFARTLVRLVPFEPLSCLATRGWHDSLTNTYVVKKSDKNFLNNNSEANLLDR